SLVIKDMGGKSFYQGQTGQEIIARIREIPESPQIEHLDGDLSEAELADLYASCHCLVHPSRGERFGLPIAEAMASGLAGITTGFGAALAFCTSDTAYLLAAPVDPLQNKR